MQILWMDQKSCIQTLGKEPITSFNPASNVRKLMKFAFYCNLCLKLAVFAFLNISVTFWRK